MTSAKGNFDFFRRECVVGTAFSVDRTYFGGQLAVGEGVTLDLKFVNSLNRYTWDDCLHWQVGQLLEVADPAQIPGRAGSSYR